MAFGFSKEEDKDNGKPKEIEHKHSDTIPAHKWETISVGTRVRSVLTGTKGEITEKTSGFFDEIRIAWDNGKESFEQQKKLAKVIIID